MGLFSNRLEKESLKPGDHIYSWRAAYIYAHHGIYIGDEKVIHFTRIGQGVGTATVLEVIEVCSVPPPSLPPCPDCTRTEYSTGVITSCLNCFLAGGNLYRFEYAAPPAFLLAKRSGTCTLAASDPPEAVLHRANYLLNHGFGVFNTFKNNCEDFAIYCKTSLIVKNKNTKGPTGQMASIFGAPLASVLATTLILVKKNIYVKVLSDVAAFSIGRYVADVGVRSDVEKISVEDLVRNGF